MKFVLVLGDKTQNFEIGESKFAREAIEAYACYLVSGDHKLIFKCNAALFELFASNPSTQIKNNILTILGEHARFKIENEKDVYKKFYFISAACDIQLKLNGRLDPEWQIIYQRHEAMLQQNFNTQKALEAGLALMDAEIVPDKQPEKLEKLNTYSVKFFAKVHAEKTWKPYPSNKLPPNKAGHDVHFIKFADTERELAEHFSSKLKKHGFTAQIQNSNNGLFLSTDLSLATPSFK